MPDYAPGTPSWVELSSPDPDASVSFYGSLFGWTATEPGPEDETGGYRMFQQGDAQVAGLMKTQAEEQPVIWATYVSVADADATAEAVADAGGQTLVPVMDVMDIGRMAFFADPTGAVFGVWQPKTFSGADLVNEPVSLCWNELATRDPEGAKTFYTQVFGWEPNAGPAGNEDAYVMWMLDGKPVGGMMAMGDDMPDEVPAYWGVCFAVADADAIAEKVEELGGAVSHAPMDIAIGRFGVFADPQGAAFAVMQFPDQA
jgi:predicted enzyme related to lactoylglutathione lyase